ncbi:PREDICTED: calmodulin-binding protein 25 [Tarenaya hassleriana]|uniref:calmodulin-binding protein 25 n=1 Tax=Tarenaya hassleriana TaxID=28532 RepID=UPI00053C58DB|nr:PREDICTED: calmodulin-binding protein 25 [Tarenaya hassleriana]
MASSEGLTSVEPWPFRQSLGVDSWLIPESTFSRDSDMLTRALHKSFSTTQQHHNQILLSDPLYPSALLDSSAISEPPLSPAPPPATNLSNVSAGSDRETAGTKRKRNGGPAGKPLKRRSRTSKKSQTTFITADPENFRQMVQQVTGAKHIGSSHSIFAPIVKPEPQRLANLQPSDRLGLPTLDTSAFLSNHHQESQMAGSNAFSGDGTGSVLSPITSFQSIAAAEIGGSAVEFDTYPTLESWKVM